MNRTFETTAEARTHGWVDTYRYPTRVTPDGQVMAIDASDHGQYGYRFALVLVPADFQRERGNNLNSLKDAIRILGYSETVYVADEMNKAGRLGAFTEMFSSEVAAKALAVNA